MTDPNRDYLSGGNNNQQLPNATATLVLGILSIVVCFICGIIAYVISNKDVALYKANPELYSAASYNNIKAGRICALIGIILQVLGLIIYIIFIAFFISVASSSDFR
jgi:ABC-type spermidine/putrescine transport system permease subunit II